MPPAARLTDMHVCPMVTGLVPHVGGPVDGPCEPTVLIEGLPAARVTDMLVCVGPPDMIAMGSPTVLIGGLMAARMGDPTVHGGVIVVGAPTVMIGEAGSPSPGAGGLGGIVAGLGLSGASQPVNNSSVYSTPGGGVSNPGGFSGVMSGLQSFLSQIGVSVSLPGAFKASGDDRLDAIVEGVNPSNSVVNCGNIIDAVVSRLNGSDPNAVSPANGDGSFTDIEQRFNTKISWGQGFQNAFDAVKAGGDKTTAIIGIIYPGGTSSHVLVMTNDNGTVGILEAQNWGGDNPKEVITNAAEANSRYNGDGGSNIGYGILPKN
jgi:uncharacterized Zn-binding protein involved in type VI secretion